MSFHWFTKPVFVLLLILVASITVADDLKDTLFSTAKAALRDANNELANVLAPVNYAEGANAYQSAERRYDKGHKVAKVELDLVAAESYFRHAVKAAKLAQMTFKSTLQARTDAKGVSAEKLATAMWQDAEKTFLLATKTLETGKRDKAMTRAADAEALYRDAELIAIKGNYLSQARAKIAEADRLKVKRYAPESLSKAKKLLATAETELSENRYDTDYPRALVKDAFYEARHSIYLADQVRALNKGGITPEQLILRLERPLGSVAGQLDVVAEFDKGVEPPLALVSERLETLQQHSHELTELQSRTAQLEQDYAALETRLGIQSERIKQEEDARARLQRVNEYFDRGEAAVLTQGDNVLIRLVGLSFAPGSEQIDTYNFAVLQKLEKVLKLYPDYTVVIEGHTDSFGSTAANQMLSLNRAKAVRQYLLVHIDDILASRLEAQGYGESRPIANNETVEGRKRNRRIDLLLKPPV